MASATDDEVAKILLTVDDAALDPDDDLFDVKTALMPVVARWRAVGEGLRLKGGKLDEIHANYPNDTASCMGAVASEWLKKNYSVGRFGEPTWRKLVEVIGSPMGGNNLSHARKISLEHLGSKEKKLNKHISQHQMGTLASSQREAQEQELIKATNQIAELKQELREEQSWSMIEDSPQWENQPATVSTQQGDSTGKEIDTLQQKIEELHGSEELAEAVKKIMELKEVLKNLKSSTQSVSQESCPARKPTKIPPPMTLQPQERTGEQQPPTSEKDGVQRKSAQQSQQYQTPRRATAKTTIKLKWESRRHASTAMWRGVSAVSGSSVYCNRTFEDAVFMYNSNKDEWSRLPDCPNICFGLAVVNGYITAIGGSVGDSTNSTNTLLSLEESSGSQQWREVFPCMPTARDDPAVLSTRHSLVVAGGWESDTVEIMDTNSLQWSSASRLPEPLERMSMTDCGEQIYMLGGMDKCCNPTNAVYACSLSALLQSCQPQSQVQSTQFSVWQRVADVPLHCSTCVSIGGQLVSLGGCNSSGEPKDVIYQYDPVINSWSVISHMPTAHYYCTVAVLFCEKLVVVGGLGANYRSLAVVEVASVV